MPTSDQRLNRAALTLLDRVKPHLPADVYAQTKDDLLVLLRLTAEHFTHPFLSEETPAAPKAHTSSALSVAERHIEVAH